MNPRISQPKSLDETDWKAVGRALFPSRWGKEGTPLAARLWGEGAELARPSFRNLRAPELDKQTGPAAGER